MNLADHYSMINVPLCRQSTSYTCGPAALQSILGYYCEEYQEDYLALALKTEPIIGTDFREIIRFCNQHDYLAYFYENTTITHIKQCIDNNIPVILMIQAWSDTLVDYQTSWSNGHYVVACGYSKDTLIIMDPSTLGNHTYITTNELLPRWHLRDQYGDYIHSIIVIKSSKTTSRFNHNKLKHLD